MIFKRLWAHLFPADKYKKWISIQLLDRIQTGTTNSGQSRPGSKGNEEVLYIS